MTSADLRREYAEGLRPPPDYDPASWAEACRILTSAETPEPGHWRNDRFPPGVEPMQRMALHDPTPRVVLMFAAQLIKSEILLNVAGYIVDHSPCPIMMLRPTLEDAEGFSKQRLRHLFESPALAGKVREPRSRDSGNTLMLKEFAGGLIVLAGANSPIRLRGWPIRVLLADEIDGYPESAGTEGDPLLLARVRLSASGQRAKELDASTPTVRGKSRIETEYEASSMARYYVPCPHCGERILLTWPMLCWAGDPEVEDGFDAWIECSECHQRIDEHRKRDLLAGGEWRHEHPERRVKGYQISALYAAPGRLTWRQLVSEWIRANDRAKVGDTSLLQVFVNTRLAETWEDLGEKVDATALEQRPRFEPARPIPRAVRAITIGVDTQDDRLEAEVVGWGHGMESWSLGYYVIPTDPIDRGTWRRLEEIIGARWHREDGVDLVAQATCIDAGGHRTQAVYDFVRGKRSRWVCAVKGMSGARAIWTRKPSKVEKGKTHLYLVGVDTAKDAVASYLRIIAPGPGYAHFPADRDAAYFAQLTAEHRQKIRTKDGRDRWGWVCPPGVRNEALDCRVYALAALHCLLTSGLRIERVAGPVPLPVPEPEPAPVAPVKPPAKTPLPEPPKPRQPAPRGAPRPSGWITGRGPRRWL